MKHYIYTNFGTFFPSGVIFECDAEDITAADKLFAAAKGKKMSDKECSQVSTWSPDWGKTFEQLKEKYG
jgi:hypothetical protein